MINRIYWRSVGSMYVLGFLSLAVGIVPLVTGVCYVWEKYKAGTFGAVEWREFALLLLVGALATGGVSALFRAMFLNQYPQCHAAYRSLAAFGPPLAVARAIDLELANAAEIVYIGKPLRSFRLSSSLHQRVQVTRSWVVQPTSYGVRVARLDDIIWVQKGSGFLLEFGAPTAYVEVKVRRGEDVRFPLADTDARRLLLELLTRLPWVLSGFEPERDRQWQANREQVVQAVEQERQQIQSLSPDARRSMLDDKIKALSEPEA